MAAVPTSSSVSLTHYEAPCESSSGGLIYDTYSIDSSNYVG
jgi:hypothetical protein